MSRSIVAELAKRLGDLSERPVTFGSPRVGNAKRLSLDQLARELGVH
jgi:hypothetical protein